jgi:hypothetical protein
MSDNQHYVTRAYLDKFIHPATGQNVLFPYARSQGGRRATGTRQLASADNFYARMDGSGTTNELDESRKEDEALYFGSGKRSSGPIAKCIYDDKYLPNADDRVTLASAAALLWWGSPVQIHNTAMMALMANQMYVFNQLNTDYAKQLYAEEYGADAEARLREDREALLEGKLTVDVGEENWKQLGFESCSTKELFVNTLCRMGLTICLSHYNSFFITSDNPVVLTSSLQPDQPGLGLSDAEIWFPVSYRVGLLWRWRHGNVQRDTFGHSQTRVMNRRMVRWCYKEVYSPQRESWIEAAVMEVDFDPCYGHYGTLQRLLESAVPAATVPHLGKQTGEVVDTIAGLRTGEKCDVVKL